MLLVWEGAVGAAEAASRSVREGHVRSQASSVAVSALSLPCPTSLHATRHSPKLAAVYQDTARSECPSPSIIRRTRRLHSALMWAPAQPQAASQTCRGSMGVGSGKDPRRPRSSGALIITSCISIRSPGSVLQQMLAGSCCVSTPGHAAL